MNEDVTRIEDGNIAVSEELKELGNFTMMPNSILSNPDLSSHEVRLWGLLYSYFYGDNKIYPGMARLAKEMNCSDDTVLRARKKLEANGLLSVIRRGHKKTNTYTLHLPKKTAPNSDSAPVRCVHAAPVRDKEDRENNTEKEKKEKMEQKARKEKPDCGYAASSPLKTKNSVTETTQRPQLRNGPSTIPPQNRPCFSHGCITNTDPIRVSIAGRTEHILKKHAENADLTVTEKNYPIHENLDGNTNPIEDT